MPETTTMRMTKRTREITLVGIIGGSTGVSVAVICSHLPTLERFIAAGAVSAAVGASLALIVNAIRELR
jgi:hypothetical protein